MRYSTNFTQHAAKSLQITMATQARTCVTHRPDWRHPADRSPIASSEKSDARERRSLADPRWTANRRRPVIGNVTRQLRWGQLGCRFHGSRRQDCLASEGMAPNTHANVRPTGVKSIQIFGVFAYFASSWNPPIPHSGRQRQSGENPASIRIT